METMIGAEVTDAAGEPLGKVTKETAEWLLVEKLGAAIQESRVVMKDEVQTVIPIQVRLLVTQSAMQTRGDRPGVTAAQDK